MLVLRRARTVTRTMLGAAGRVRTVVHEVTGRVPDHGSTQVVCRHEHRRTVRSLANAVRLRLADCLTVLSVEKIGFLVGTSFRQAVETTAVENSMVRERIPEATIKHFTKTRRCLTLKLCVSVKNSHQKVQQIIADVG